MTERRLDQSEEATDEFTSFSSPAGADGRSEQFSNKVILIVGLATEGSCNLAVLLAERGSDIAIVYSDEAYEAAMWVSEQVEALGRRCLAIVNKSGNYRAQEVVQEVVSAFGRLDVFISYPLRSDLNAPSFVNGAGMNGTGRKALRYLYRSTVFPNFSFLKAALNQIVQ